MCLPIFLFTEKTDRYGQSREDLIRFILTCLADCGKEITTKVQGSGEIRAEWNGYEKLGNLTDLTP